MNKNVGKKILAVLFIHLMQILLMVEVSSIIIEKIIWLILNFLNNNLPPKYFDSKKLFYPNTKVKIFTKNIRKIDWLKISRESTPSRMFCDLFWLKLNWKAIKSELGNINIFDTGCGDGNYGIKINEFASGINSYYAIDEINTEIGKPLIKFNL